MVVIKVILISLYAMAFSIDDAHEETWNILLMRFCCKPLEKFVQVNMELAREIPMNFPKEIIYI